MRHPFHKEFAMPYSPQDTFAGDWTNFARKLVSTYKFEVTGVGTEVTIQVYELIGRPGYFYETSHAIHTPVQATPYHSSVRVRDTEADAVHKAVGDLKTYFDQAIKEGHKPDAAWFVPNKN